MESGQSHLVSIADVAREVGVKSKNTIRQRCKELGIELTTIEGDGKKTFYMSAVDAARIYDYYSGSKDKRGEAKGAEADKADSSDENKALWALVEEARDGRRRAEDALARKEIELNGKIMELEEKLAREVAKREAAQKRYESYIQELIVAWPWQKKGIMAKYALPAAGED